jgi:hypothetical protein
MTCCTPAFFTVIPLEPLQFARDFRLADHWGAQAFWPRQTFVIRTQAELEAAWAMARPLDHLNLPAGAVVTPPSLPGVDFSRTALVGVSAGAVSSPCSGFGIRAIARTGTDYRVDWGFADPPPMTSCAAVIDSAVTFMQVPQPVGRVEFVRRDLCSPQSATGREFCAP